MTAGLGFRRSGRIMVNLGLSGTLVFAFGDYNPILCSSLSNTWLTPVQCLQAIFINVAALVMKIACKHWTGVTQGLKTPVNGSNELVTSSQDIIIVIP